MQEQEITLREMLSSILSKWRGILIFTIIAAVLVGGIVGGGRLLWYCNADTMAHGKMATLFDARIEEKKLLEETLSSLEVTLKTKEAQINATQVMIAEEQKKIEQLKVRAAKEETQLENSVYMAIDPYHVQVSERYFRVDTGYQILPTMPYQTPDRTSEVMQAYIIDVRNEAFYNQVIHELGLQNIDAASINEVINIDVYNSSSFLLKVVGPSNEFTSRIANYISDCIIANHSKINSTVTEHEVLLYSTLDYSHIDLNINDQQQNRLATLSGLKNTIYTTEVENFEAKSEKLTIEKEILDLEKSIKVHRLKLADFNYNPKSILIGFIKYAVIGGAVAAVLAVVIILLLELVSGHILSAAQCEALVSKSFFGKWPESKKISSIGKKIDHLIMILEGTASTSTTTENAQDLVLSNLEQELNGFSGQLLLCGGAPVTTIQQIGRELQERCPNAQICCGGNIAYDSKTVFDLQACDSVVIVERCGKSTRTNIYAFCQRAKTLDKPVLGFILG